MISIPDGELVQIKITTTNGTVFTGGTDLAMVAASMAVSEEASGQHLNSEEWDFLL